MQNFAMRLMGGKINAWLQRNKLTDLAWHDADALAMHRANYAKDHERWFSALRRYPVVLVGPPWLEQLRIRIPNIVFIPTPITNAFLQLPRLEDDIRRSVASLGKPYVVSVSCGMPAGLLVDRVYSDLGEHAWLLDMGSFYDLHVGKLSRKYMRTLAP
jgi:hypothetical protein